MQIQLDFKKIRDHICILEQEQHEIRILLSCWEQSSERICQDPEALHQVNYLRDLESRTRERIQLLEEMIAQFSRLKSKSQEKLHESQDILDSLK